MKASQKHSLHKRSQTKSVRYWFYLYDICDRLNESMVNDIRKCVVCEKGVGHWLEEGHKGNLLGWWKCSIFCLYVGNMREYCQNSSSTLRIFAFHLLYVNFTWKSLIRKISIKNDGNWLPLSYVVFWGPFLFMSKWNCLSSFPINCGKSSTLLGIWGLVDKQQKGSYCYCL